LKTAFIKLFLLVFMLAGCQQLSQTVIYTGTSESWSAEVVIHKSSGKESEDIVIKYLNQDLNIIESFSYKLEAPNWGTAQDDVKLNSEGVFQEEGASLNDRETGEDAKITLTIEWSGKTEEVTLEKK
jgi:hypothetical protein